MLLTTAAHAEVDITPSMTMKERLRLNMWTYGVSGKPKPRKISQYKRLPEELWKPLRKI